MHQRDRDESLRQIQSQRQLQQGVKDGKTVLNKKYTAEKDKCGGVPLWPAWGKQDTSDHKAARRRTSGCPSLGCERWGGCTQFGFAMPKRRGIIHSPQHEEVNKARNNEIKLQQGKLNTAVIATKTSHSCVCATLGSDAYNCERGQ